jgi:hypothetical protein
MQKFSLKVTKRLIEIITSQKLRLNQKQSTLFNEIYFLIFNILYDDLIVFNFI